MEKEQEVTTLQRHLQLDVDVPSAFFDNVFTYEVMRDPVTTPAGHTFERHNVEHWIRLRGTCPLTRIPLAVSDLVENRALKEAIGTFFKEREGLGQRLAGLQAERQRLLRKIDSLERKQRRSIDRFIDPINGALMVLPVVAADGQTYDKSSIELWFRNRRAAGSPIYSPVTRQPLADESLRPNPALAREIAAWRRTQRDGDGSAAAVNVTSVEHLSPIFDILDGVASDLKDCLDSWEPPRVVVLGDQSHGKSTLLERLCLMPLFPRKRGLCTSAPVKVSIRRSPTAMPAHLQLWDNKHDRPMGKPRIVPLNDGHVDVREAMTAAMRGETCDVTVDRELRLTIYSPTLPLMNLVDLPGLVQLPDALREATHTLIDSYLSQHEKSSVFLVVVRADSSPRTSEALGIIIKRKLEAKTIGVLTFCDKLDTDEDHEILQQVLTNSTAGGKECVPLKPHGYVATTNREIRKVAGESNRSRLLTQAEAEIRWFKEEGYAIDGTVTTDALISKLGTIYAEYVRESFIPRTLLQIFIKNREYEEQQRQLGLPAPPPTSSREELLASATTFAVQLFADVYTAHREFVRDTTLPAMASKLGELLQPRTIPVFDLKNVLTDLGPSVKALLHGVFQDITQRWIRDIEHACKQNSLPFRLQRFPKLAEELRTIGLASRHEVPEIEWGVFDDFLSTALDCRSSFIQLTFSADNTESVAVAFSGLVTSITGLLVMHLNTPNDIQDGSAARAACNRVFDDTSQIQETCHDQRHHLVAQSQKLQSVFQRILPLHATYSKAFMAQPFDQQMSCLFEGKHHEYRNEEKGCTMHYVSSSGQWWVSSHKYAQLHEARGCLYATGKPDNPPGTKWKQSRGGASRFAPHVKVELVDNGRGPGKEDIRIIAKEPYCGLFRRQEGITPVLRNPSLVKVDPSACSINKKGKIVSAQADGQQLAQGGLTFEIIGNHKDGTSTPARRVAVVDNKDGTYKLRGFLSGDVETLSVRLFGCDIRGAPYPVKRLHGVARCAGPFRPGVTAAPLAISPWWTGQRPLKTNIKFSAGSRDSVGICKLFHGTATITLTAARSSSLQYSQQRSQFDIHLGFDQAGGYNRCQWLLDDYNHNCYSSSNQSPHRCQITVSGKNGKFSLNLSGYGRIVNQRSGTVVVTPLGPHRDITVTCSIEWSGDTRRDNSW
eukprot:INCI1543.4.p1 GENE.INCI1543.4~~INCI1543.4.p1  ORF type:complete len:1172 (-),score=123.94 INCI1543.4:157-3672(-)